MFRLKLNAKLCISCGICMDVCQPLAIDMRVNILAKAEGDLLSYLQLHSVRNRESFPEKMMTFPYLSRPSLCDGCMLCVNECPTTALELQQVGQSVYA
ncbi:MAG: 4Fe-4S binding protein [Ignavibacteriales bacterium]|nr:4Fe-4S binding protein [Ignavibacteriales bacterium]